MALPPCPLSRPAALVGKGNDGDRVFVLAIDKVVRKPLCRHLPTGRCGERAQIQVLDEKPDDSQDLVAECLCVADFGFAGILACRFGKLAPSLLREAELHLS